MPVIFVKYKAFKDGNKNTFEQVAEQSQREEEAFLDVDYSNDYLKVETSSGKDMFQYKTFALNNLDLGK
jgi:hypothetical protein